MEYREPNPWKYVLNYSRAGMKETTLIPDVEEITL
jgi:hypothetical protein